MCYSRRSARSRAWSLVSSGWGGVAALIPALTLLTHGLLRIQTPCHPLITLTADPRLTVLGGDVGWCPPYQLCLWLPGAAQDPQLAWRSSRGFPCPWSSSLCFQPAKLAFSSLSLQWVLKEPLWPHPASAPVVCSAALLLLGPRVCNDLPDACLPTPGKPVRSQAVSAPPAGPGLRWSADAACPLLVSEQGGPLTCSRGAVGLGAVSLAAGLSLPGGRRAQRAGDPEPLGRKGRPRLPGYAASTQQPQGQVCGGAGSLSQVQKLGGKAPGRQ